MSSDQQRSSGPPCYNVILLGKTGSGKSAVGNTLLGEEAFISKKSSKGVTEEVQKKSGTFNGVTLHVYDTPGLFNPVTNNNNIIREWKPLLQLDESAHTVFLLVMKADRLAAEEKESVDLIVEFIPEWLLPNTWILFTRGDELEREEVTIEEFIEDMEGLKEVVQRFENRYHVFSNFNKSPEQVRELVNKIKEGQEITLPEMGFQTTPSDPEADPLHRRIVVLGKTGVGKSASGNTILGEKRFTSELSLSSTTSQCQIEHGVISGRKVSVIDTPGLFDTTKSPEELGEEMARSIDLSSPGPHAFLHVQPINVKFTEQEENVIQKLEQIFGKEMGKYTMFLFTHGDQLEGKSVDELIQENTSLRIVVDKCEGGYHVFNNKHLMNRKQVSELLQKIDRMVEENGGSYYSNQMFEEAARIRKEEETERPRKEEERERPRKEEETERPGKEEETTERPGKEEETTERPGKDEETTERPGKEEETERPGKEEETTERPGKEEERTERPGKDEETNERPRKEEETNERPGKEEETTERPGKEEETTERPGKEEETQRPGKRRKRRDPEKRRTERPGKEEETTERPGKEEETTERPGKEEETTERPGKEEETTERPGKEEETTERPGKEEETTERPGKEEETTERPGKEEETTERPGKEEETTERPGKEEETTERPGKEEETTERPGKEEETTERPGKEEETTERPGKRRKRRDPGKRRKQRPGKEEETERPGKEEETERPGKEEETVI